MAPPPLNDPCATGETACDVLVIGGGPAGSTAATLLAERGYHVHVLDKDRHPRFHIGESLLPANLPLFERLGVADDIRAIGMHKPGAEFVSPHHAHTQTFMFAEAWNKALPSAYQVKRAEFDQVLLRNAARKGAAVHEGCRATAVSLDEPDGGVRVTARLDDGQEHHWRARFLVDASGRDTFLASKFRIKDRNPRHSSAAVYAHFRHARRHEGEAEGNITIFWFEHGWFWFIPMTEDTTSVGMVTWPYHMKTRQGRSLERFLMDNIATCDKLQERLAQAERMTEVEATGNFSYVAQRNHGANFQGWAAAAPWRWRSQPSRRSRQSCQSRRARTERPAGCAPAGPGGIEVRSWLGSLMMMKRAMEHRWKQVHAARSNTSTSAWRPPASAIRGSSASTAASPPFRRWPLMSSSPCTTWT